MNNMLIRPTPEELANYGDPDFIIYNAGQFPANRFTTGMTSATSVEINFKRMEMVILGCVMLFLPKFVRRADYLWSNRIEQNMRAR